MLLEEILKCSHREKIFDSRFTLAGTTSQYAPDRTFDTEHTKLELDLDIPKKTLQGICTLSVKAIVDQASQMVLDAVDFKVNFVKVANRKTKFDYDKKKLIIHFLKPVKAGAKSEIQIGYRITKPKMGIYFIGPDRDYPTKPVQVWTQGQDEYARYWFPCHDAPQERMTSEILAKVPKGFTAISNGRLAKKQKKGSKTLFHWKQDIPHASYLVTLAVGEFSEIKDKWRKTPVLYYCPPGREEDTKRAFGKTPKMMEFFSKMIGVPYAYPKYAQVAAVDFIYGGMENTSATTQTALTLHDERAHLDFSSDFLVAHELAHQWFGDLLTCKEWCHAWLNESFATYFEALFTEHDRGQDEFLREIEQNRQTYFDEDKTHYRRPIMTNVYKQPSDIFDRHLYEKGSVVLHMLRYLLGDKDFWTSINTYVKDNRENVVETRDFLHAIQKATGKNMGRFFEQWIYKAGHPEYKVRYWWDSKNKEANVRVIQTHSVNTETGLFSMPIEFSFYTEKGEKRFKKMVDKKSHLFKFNLSSEPHLVLFDPDHWLLKKVNFQKSESMWIEQLKKDPNPIGRSEAAKALGKWGGVKVVQALESALKKEPFWGVQGDIATALGEIHTPDSMDVLLMAHRYIEHPKARRFLIAAMGNFAESTVRLRLKTTYQSEKSYFAEVQALRSLGKAGDSALIPLFTELMKKDSWNDILRCGSLDSLASLKPANIVDVLKRYTKYGYSPMLRMTAIRCLPSIGGSREDVRKLLEDLLNDSYLLVQISALGALTKIGDERSVPILDELKKQDIDGRLKRDIEESILKLKEGIESNRENKSSK